MLKVSSHYLGSKMLLLRDNHSIIPLPLPHCHLGDEGITNILSDVLIESQGQKTTIGDTTYD